MWLPKRLVHRWTLAQSLLSGLLALAWLVLRSGARPHRLAYPCQQAALSTATLALGAPLVAAALGLRRRLARLPSTLGVTAAAIALAATFGVWGALARLEASRGPEAQFLRAPEDYRAQLFHLRDCPRDPVGDRFPCIEGLLALMGREGIAFYRSPSVGPTSGPDGLFAADDVIVLKINYQWAERGGTNVDVLQGLVRALIDHPDGFSGEIVVCENAQFASTSGFDRADNNGEDINRSPFDVVAHFQDLGHDVSLFDWTTIRFDAVEEYSAGDLTDGYVVYPEDPQVGGRVSYPKFETDLGTYISLRDGIWDPSTATYDRARLRFINLPVLKSHIIYGVTANVKDYMGVVTTGLPTDSHNAMREGLLGQLLGEILLADLNILDAIWINAHPNGGPATDYAEATRRDELVAGADPVAADLWATVNILLPAFEDNGYDQWPRADPFDPGSDFRQYLDSSSFYMLAAGLDVTADLDRIDVSTLTMTVFADGFESGDVDAWSATLP